MAVDAGSGLVGLLRNDLVGGVDELTRRLVEPPILNASIELIADAIEEIGPGSTTTAVRDACADASGA